MNENKAKKDTQSAYSRDMMTNLAFLVDTLNAVQKLRQSTGNRIIHLRKQGREDKVIEHYHNEFQRLEDSLVDVIHPIVKSHPAWGWARKVKGVGPENFAKVIAPIEKFKKDGKVGIECFDTPSKFVRFRGWAVIDGKPEKKVSGQKLHFSVEARTMDWRLGQSLLRAEGKFYKFYLEQKEYLRRRAEAEGKKIIPTPKGKFCPKCLKVVEVKKAKYCPVCEAALEKKREPEGVLFEGHLHNAALRRMIRMFDIMLYISWRQALGLPVPVPYTVAKLGHNKVYTPEDFIDEEVED